jgi:hypothetical protein
MLDAFEGHLTVDSRSTIHAENTNFGGMTS